MYDIRKKYIFETKLSRIIQEHVTKKPLEKPLEKIVDAIEQDQTKDAAYTSALRRINLNDVDIQYVTSMAYQLSTHFFQSFHAKVIFSGSKQCIDEFYAAVKHDWKIMLSNEKGTDERVKNNMKENHEYLKREYECQEFAA